MNLVAIYVRIYIMKPTPDPLSRDQYNALTWFNVKGYAGPMQWQTFDFLHDIHRDIFDRHSNPNVPVALMHELIHKNYIIQDIVCGVVNVLRLTQKGRDFITTLNNERDK